MTFEIDANKLKKIKVEVKSSFIDFLEYSREDSALTVKYKKRGLFKKKVKHFQEIAPQDFFDILNSKSIGKSFMRLIHKL